MNKGLLIGAVLAASLTAATAATAADYIIDKKGQHASVNFKASHLGYSYVVGRFNDFDGKFSHDAKDPSAASISVTISAKSIDSNHAERDKHLRSADFFDVDKYPTITFVSTGYDGKTLNGDLTIKGVTKNVAIAATHIGEGDDPWGGYRSGFEGSVMIKAADFSLPDWLGDVQVDLHVEGIRQ